MKILNFGSLNIDYVYSVDHMVEKGETLSSNGMNIFCGGKGLNQSISLSKAGAEVYHAGLIGNEGDILLNACTDAEVKVDYIRRTQGKSGHTIIQVDKEGQNCILLYGGANQEMTIAYIDEVLSDFDKGDLLLLQNEINLIDYIVDVAYEKGMTIIMNPSPFNEKLNRCDFRKISLLLINEIEAVQITGQKEEMEALEKLRVIYPETQVVMTLGGEGSVYQYKDTQVRQPIYKVPVVDTTAAGDTFTGYFIASMLHNLSIKEGLDYAAKAAAIAVTRAGATSSIPFKEEVEQSNIK